MKTKSQLIGEIQKKLGKDASKAAAERALDVVIDCIKKCVKDAAKKVSKKKPSETALIFLGFGSFRAKRREARTGRNPRTGKAIKIKAAKVPYFKPTQQFKDSLNK